MKKNINLILLGILVLLNTSCFKDDGNYDYEELNPPTWLINVNEQLIYVTGRGGSDVTLDASKQFTWGERPADARKDEVSYKWTLNGRVISNQLTETLPTDELLKRAGLKDYPIKSMIGNFIVVENKTGIEFKARTMVTFKPPITSGDFVVYSEKKGGGAGTLSTLFLKYDRGEGVTAENVILNTNISEVSGTPKELVIAEAKNVSPTGSVTAITKEGDAVVFSASTLKRVWDIRDQFLDGAPADLKVSAMRYQEVSSSQPSFTWLASQDGKIYTRQKGKNYLGGQFINEPYFLDKKGYKITKFGHTLWGITNIPCYDEKNRRVLIATCLPHNATNTYRAFISVLKNPGYQGVPVQEMPEGTKVLHLSNVISGQGWFVDRNSSWYAVFYTANGKSYMGKFAVSNRSRQLMTAGFGNHWYRIKQSSFTDETVFLTSACVRYSRQLPPRYDLFTEGTKIFAIIKSSNYTDHKIEVKELPFKGIESKITCMTYDRDHDIDYRHLLVGCENGDLLVYDIKALPEPKLVKKLKMDGRVAAIKQLGLNRTTMDLY